SPFVSRAIVLVERLMGLLTTFVLVPCGSQWREIVEDFRVVPQKKVRIIRYGIPVDEFGSLPAREDARRRFEIAEDALIVGTIGRMAHVKNHRLLLESFNLLPASIGGRSVELLLFGDGECRPEIEERVEELDLASRVHFRDWVDDLRWAYSAIDVMAISSRNEGMPIAALEAMAAGVPVVSTAVGGVVDLIEDGKSGLLVREHDPKVFAEKLASLLEDVNLRNRIVEAGRIHVQEKYSRSALIQSSRSFYKFLIRKRLHQSV
ncbi:MAG: glycosyltransferase family 4 protein, partial [bacterium]